MTEYDGVSGNATQYSMVAYVNGPQPDQPLGLLRENADGTWLAWVLHRDWQGAVDAATLSNGTTIGTLVDCRLTSNASGCVSVPWAGLDQSVGFQRPVTNVGQVTWWGTLIGGIRTRRG